MGYSQSRPSRPRRTRSDVPVDAEQPVPERRAAAAGNTLGPNTFLGQSLNRFMPIGAATASSRATWSTCSAGCRRWLLEVGYAGSRGFNMTTNEELNGDPARTCPRAGCATRPRSISSARRCPIRSPAFCRPASPARTWRARSCCGRSRSSTTCRPTASTAPAMRLVSDRIERRFANGYSIMGTYTFVAFHRQGLG